MHENFYDVELRKEMGARRVKELGDSAPFFARLMKHYPTVASKIHWCSIPGSVERLGGDETSQSEGFISFFDEVVEKFCLTGDVVYVGDSAIDLALTGSIERIREALPELLAIPQHHYLIGPGSSWCMCFTMEGDMGFSLAPARTTAH